MQYGNMASPEVRHSATASIVPHAYFLISRRSEMKGTQFQGLTHHCRSCAFQRNLRRQCQTKMEARHPKWRHAIRKLSSMQHIGWKTYCKTYRHTPHRHKMPMARPPGSGPCTSKKPTLVRKPEIQYGGSASDGFIVTSGLVFAILSV